MKFSLFAYSSASFAFVFLSFGASTLFSLTVKADGASDSVTDHGAQSIMPTKANDSVLGSSKDNAPAVASFLGRSLLEVPPQGMRQLVDGFHGDFKEDDLKEATAGALSSDEPRTESFAFVGMIDCASWLGTRLMFAFAKLPSAMSARKAKEGCSFCPGETKESPPSDAPSAFTVKENSVEAPKDQKIKGENFMMT